MSALYILIGVSMCVALGFLISFLWSVKKGQFDDDYANSVRLLFDDMELDEQNAEENKEETKDTNIKKQQ